MRASGAAARAVRGRLLDLSAKRFSSLPRSAHAHSAGQSSLNLETLGNADRARTVSVSPIWREVEVFSEVLLGAQAASARCLEGKTERRWCVFCSRTRDGVVALCSETESQTSNASQEASFREFCDRPENKQLVKKLQKKEILDVIRREQEARLFAVQDTG